jgi:ATP-dependent DNA ligase
MRPLNGGRLDLAPPKHGTWRHEPKYNGWRALVHVPSATMFNRHLQLLSIAHEFEEALSRLKQTPVIWADVEALERRHGIGRGTLILLDELDPTSGYAWRKARLQRWVPTHDPTIRPAENQLLLSQPFRGDRELYEMLKRLNAEWGCEFYEGIVSKEVDSPYAFSSSTQDSHHWVKHRWRF